MASPPSQGGVDLAPPPREGPFTLVRRWWRSRGQHRPLRYWLLFRGIPALVAFAALFAANGLVIGWRKAYDVMLAIISPADTSSPVLAWLLSLAGWLVGPAVAGAVVGYMITAAIEGRRKKPIAELFREVDHD
jgi:hypothetical protein